MYCQFCGAEATQELNYCKRCGRNLNPLANVGGNELARPAISPLSVWGIGITTLVLVVGSLLILFGFITDMARNNFHPTALVWLALFGVITILGSVALLMRLWRFVLGGASIQSKQQNTFQPPRPIPTSELPPHKASILPDPVPSVTEHTTRTLQQKSMNSER